MADLEIIGVRGFPIIRKGDPIIELIVEHVVNTLSDLSVGDVVVIAHTILSRAGYGLVELEQIVVSPLAKAIAKAYDKDPRHVQVVLDQGEVVKLQRGIIIMENESYHVAANAGVDQSNAGRQHVVTLPSKPNELADMISQAFHRKLGFSPGIIISDTAGRALRVGAINIAIGVSSFPTIKDYKGKKDLFGYELKITEIAIADEIASAAEPVMGQANEAIPIVIIRNVARIVGQGLSKPLPRPSHQRLFK